jgi:AraC-like DNA-binding protein
LPELNAHLHGIVLKTRDADEAAALLADAAVPYRFETISASPPFSTDILILQGRSIIVSTATSTGRLWLETGMPAGSYGLALALGSGVGVHKSRGKSVDVSPNSSFVQNPGTLAEVTTRERYRVLFLRIAADALNTELQSCLGRNIRSPLVFHPEFKMGGAAGHKLGNACRNLHRVLSNKPGTSIGNSGVIADLEAGIVNLLLEAQPHNYSKEMSRFAEAGNWSVCVAKEYMRSSAHLPLTLGNICAAAGVNARTLQHTFRRAHGCTPMTFLRRIRLEAAHDGLLNPDERTTVAALATKWGFFHFGRFSRTYRAVFGELPSETLSRSRRRKHY